MKFFSLAFLFLFSGASNPETDWFLEQARSEPEVRMEDAYKWLHQATRGGEHAIISEIAVRRWLTEEWATLEDPFPGEPLWVPLRSDERIGRLNLRPYRARGGLEEPLLSAFIASAASFKSDPADFKAAWKALGRTLKKHPQGRLTVDDWKRLDALARQDDYGARHHSPAYTEARRPAYRVLTAEQAEKLIRTLSEP